METDTKRALEGAAGGPVYMQMNAGYERCQLGLDTTTLPSGEFSPRLVYLMMSCRGRKMSTQPTTLM